MHLTPLPYLLWLKRSVCKRQAFGCGNFKYLPVFLFPEREASGPANRYKFNVGINRLWK